MEQVFAALYTAAGMLWKALWALTFKYVISVVIQVLVTREQVAKVLGARGLNEAGLSGLFGFISSFYSSAACRSFATSRSAFLKGAAPLNAIAFLIAFTNLVIEFGTVFWALLGWKFRLGKFLSGVLMIAYALAALRARRSALTPESRRSVWGNHQQVRRQRKRCFASEPTW